MYAVAFNIALAFAVRRPQDQLLTILGSRMSLELPRLQLTQHCARSSSDIAAAQMQT